uniref:Uncharacterized protein n=1 Tax=Arion vulgaris TaxID=1028688 RepID=A0A0B7B5R3_9EUPU
MKEEIVKIKRRLFVRDGRSYDDSILHSLSDFQNNVLGSHETLHYDMGLFVITW